MQTKEKWEEVRVLGRSFSSFASSEDETEEKRQNQEEDSLTIMCGVCKCISNGWIIVPSLALSSLAHPVLCSAFHLVLPIKSELFKAKNSSLHPAPRTKD